MLKKTMYFLVGFIAGVAGTFKVASMYCEAEQKRYTSDCWD